MLQYAHVNMSEYSCLCPLTTKTCIIIICKSACVHSCQFYKWAKIRMFAIPDVRVRIGPTTLARRGTETYDKQLMEITIKNAWKLTINSAWKLTIKSAWKLTIKSAWNAAFAAASLPSNFCQSAVGVLTSASRRRSKVMKMYSPLVMPSSEAASRKLRRSAMGMASSTT